MKRNGISKLFIIVGVIIAIAIVVVGGYSAYRFIKDVKYAPTQYEKTEMIIPEKQPVEKREVVMPISVSDPIDFTDVTPEPIVIPTFDYNRTCNMINQDACL